MCDVHNACYVYYIPTIIIELQSYYVCGSFNGSAVFREINNDDDNNNNKRNKREFHNAAKKKKTIIVFFPLNLL